MANENEMFLMFSPKNILFGTFNILVIFIQINCLKFIDTNKFVRVRVRVRVTSFFILYIFQIKKKCMKPNKMYIRTKKMFVG
jgi:hypothetical protein